MDVIAFPFHLKNGRINVVPERSDAAAAQQILAAFRTEPGELPLQPAYGTSDPSFDRISWAEFYSTVSTYYKNIRIMDTDQALDGTGKTVLNIEFERIIDPEAGE